jgi:hypothetical protein
MQLRRPLATAVAILATAASLSSCKIAGMDYATDRVYTPGAGSNDRSGVVDILSAVVVSGSEGSGTVIASLSNNDTEQPHSLSAVSGDGISPADFEPVEVAPDGIVNLAEPPAGIHISGDFEAGNFVRLTWEFDNGETATFNVPVVPDDAGYWEGLDSSGSAAEGAAGDSPDGGE